MRTLTVEEAMPGRGKLVELALAGKQIQIRKGNRVVELRPALPAVEEQWSRTRGASPPNVHTFTESPATHIVQGFRALNIGVNVVSDVHMSTGDVHWKRPAFPKSGERVNIGVNAGEMRAVAKTLENTGCNRVSVNV